MYLGGVCVCPSFVAHNKNGLDKGLGRGKRRLLPLAKVQGAAAGLGTAELASCREV